MHSYRYIKNQIEKTGYKLLSKKYIGALKKLKVKCPQNHQYKVNYNKFQQGKRCPICYIENCNDNKRLVYDYVKFEVEKVGYKLLSDEYINAHSKLKIECSKGHKYDVTYANFYQGKRCPVCWKSGQSRSEKDCFSVIRQMTNNNVIENDRTQIINPMTGYNLELDIWIPSLNKAIEFNGKYWHDNTYSKYKDNQKVIQCREKGIDLLTIWYQNWIDNREGQINNLEGFIRK
jgi:hypothetical protein